MSTYSYGDLDNSLVDGAMKKYGMQTRSLVIYTDKSRTEEGHLPESE